MDLASFQALLTLLGQAALQEASDMQPKEADFLTLFGRMKQRQQYWACE